MGQSGRGARASDTQHFFPSSRGWDSRPQEANLRRGNAARMSPAPKTAAVPNRSQLPPRAATVTAATTPPAAQSPAATARQ
ncbi:MAG: hypothetical protein WDW38_006109 [Sanguina aurantia]